MVKTWVFGQFRAELTESADSWEVDLYQVIAGHDILIAEGVYDDELTAVHNLLVTLAEYINNWGC